MPTKIFLFVLLAFAFSPSVGAQETYRLSEYFPGAVGDRWQYKNLAPDGLSPIVVKVSAKRDFKNAQVVQRDENNGDYRLQRMDENGLTVYQLYFVGDRVIDYEKPVLLFPALLQIGKYHKAETPYQTLVKGEAKERGTQTYETEIERLETAQTPLGIFQNCLVIRTRALRTDESGAQKGYELREWHARGVGAVKVTGELFWKNAKGETTRTFKINAELERATVGGKEAKAK